MANFHRFVMDAYGFVDLKSYGAEIFKPMSGTRFFGLAHVEANWLTSYVGPLIPAWIQRANICVAMLVFGALVLRQLNKTLQ